MKKSPFGENSINKVWAKSVTLEVFTNELLQCELYSQEHIEAEWYRINEVKKGVEVETMPPTLLLNTIPNGNDSTNDGQVEETGLSGTSRGNNARQQKRNPASPKATTK